MEFRKMVTITPGMRQQKRHWWIDQSYGLCGRGRGWGDLGEWHWNMCNIMYETSRQSRFDGRFWMLGAGALGWPRGRVGGGRREEGSGWGTRVYLWWIYFDIWQNEYNIVKFKKKKEQGQDLGPARSHMCCVISHLATLNLSIFICKMELNFRGLFENQMRWSIWQRLTYSQCLINLNYNHIHWHHQMVNTKIRLIIFFAAKNGEALYSQQKQDQELTVAQIMNSLLPNSDWNWRK